MVKLNTILYTKDGRHMGNAIVVKVLDRGRYRIKTDYGNECILTKREIAEIFHIGKVASAKSDEPHKNIALEKTL